MPADAFLPLLRAHFPDAETGALRWEKIERGGSDRDFFRVTGLKSPASIILARYGVSRAENARYGLAAAFLAQHGVRVPAVYFHDDDARVLAMEDLGETDLWSFREAPWAERRGLYQSALRQVHGMHRLAASDVKADGLLLEPGFDAALYRWEQGYFFEHCLGGALADRVDQEAARELHARSEWDDIAKELALLPRRLVHRDFQSQNILIREGTAALIDFQGMRPGLPEYDLASLLYDPYVVLSADERQELFDFYAGLEPAVLVSARTLELCAFQRLMQALGAYGFLGLKRGKPAFLAHIPRALASLVELRADGLGPLLAELTAPARRHG